MKIMAYFIMSFALGIGLGNFFFTETPLFLTPFSFAAGQGNGTPQNLFARGGASFQVTTEMVVTLLSAALLFAAAYLLWKKYRHVQYFSHNQTHWHAY